MKKAILSILVLLCVTACAQRLQTRPKAGTGTTANTDGNAKADVTNQNVKATKGFKIHQDVKEAAKLKIPTPTQVETLKADGSIQPTLPPTEVKVQSPEIAAAQPAPSVEKVSNCAVDFVALSEKEAADVMLKISGAWMDGGINSVRNVVVSTDTNDIKRTVITLGPKNEDNSISRLTLKPAKEFVPGKIPYEVAATEPLAKVVSYRVSAPVEGFHLVELVTSSPAGTVQCSTFGFKFEAGPAKAQDALHSLGPVQEVKLTSAEFFATQKGKGKILSRQ